MNDNTTVSILSVASVFLPSCSCNIANDRPKCIEIEGHELGQGNATIDGFEMHLSYDRIQCILYIHADAFLQYQCMSIL
jgi:hypothetical protein